MKGFRRAEGWVVAGIAAALALSGALALGAPASALPEATGADPVSSASASPTPDVSPTPSPSPSPSGTASPSPSGTASPSPSGTASPSPSGTASPSPSDTPSASGEPEGPLEPFIVQVDDGATKAVAAAITDLGGRVTDTYDHALTGLAAELTPADAKALAKIDGVKTVELDLEISIADASAMVVDSGCTASTLTAGDDVGSSPIPLGFTTTWNGRTYDKVLVNTNGAVAFDDGLGAFRDYVIDLGSINRPVISVVGTDLDATSSGSVTYGPLAAPFGGKPGFCVQWSNVAEFGASSRKVTAQLLILNGNAGEVALLMNYSSISSTFSKRIEIGYAEPDIGTRVRMLGSATTASPFRDGGAYARSTNGNSNSNLSAATAPGRFFYRFGATAQPTESGGAGAPGTCSDSVPAGTQGCATWGLDRIDQRTLPLDSRFTPAGTGSGVTAYIVDTGILATHSDFTGRTSVTSGYDAVDGVLPATDCNGHGTHVAGTVAGTTYGVAKSATLVPVRVLNCSGSGSTAGVIAGIDWAIGDHVSGPAVMNLSLGGTKSLALNEAVARAVADGITVVVAAGNSTDNACSYSPASEPTAITVGATTDADAIAYFSNDGPCVDIFAPGLNITSDWYSSPTATQTISGTSMASPHVAGAAAVYLGLNPTATPAQVASALQSAGSPDSVAGATSANDTLLYVRSFAAAPAPAPAAAPAGSSSGGGSGGGSSAGGSGGGGGGGALQAITEVRPAFGPLSGGNQVSIIGYGFTGATRVEIGGKSVPFTVVNDAHVMVTMPKGDALGSADVAVVLTPARGRAFAPGGYVYQPDSVAPVPTGPTTPGQVGVLEQVSAIGSAAALPMRVALSGRIAFTQSASGVRSLRMTVPASAAGRTAVLTRKGTVVAKAMVSATGGVTFRGRALTPGRYQLTLTDGSRTSIVSTPIVLRTPTRSR